MPARLRCPRCRQRWWPLSALCRAREDGRRAAGSPECQSGSRRSGSTGPPPASMARRACLLVPCAAIEPRRAAAPLPMEPSGCGSPAGRPTSTCVTRPDGRSGSAPTGCRRTLGHSAHQPRRSPACGPTNLGHASPQMTARYATLHDTTVRRAFDTYWKDRVSILGERIAFDAAGPTADAEWTKHNLARVQSSLPNGSCGDLLNRTAPTPTPA